MARNDLYSPCRPRIARRIAVGDGHILYVEECGPADGLPVVWLHDGPGDGCGQALRRLIDPARFRAVFFDQRGAGRSWPSGGTEANTTPDLVADMERVREALAIPAWILFGDGWGAALALAYAQLFPERVLGLVLRQPRLAPGAASRGDPAADAVCAHYRQHGGFLLPGRLLADIGQVRHLPAVLLHAADDPGDDSEDLWGTWPEAATVAVPGGTGSAAMAWASMQALAWIAGCVVVEDGS